MAARLIHPAAATGGITLARASLRLGRTLIAVSVVLIGGRTIHFIERKNKSVCM